MIFEIWLGTSDGMAIQQFLCMVTRIHSDKQQQDDWAQAYYFHKELSIHIYIISAW